MAGHELPDQQPDASHCGTCRIHTRCFSAALGSLQPMFLFSLLFMFLNERCTGRKDCRKCQEETADSSAIFLRDHASDCCNQSAEHEADGVLTPLRLPQSRRIDFELHRYFSQTYQSPNAVPSHNGIEQIVAQSALGL